MQNISEFSQSFSSSEEEITREVAIPPKLCLLARCETGVWDTCDLRHLWECAANDRSNEKSRAVFPFFSWQTIFPLERLGGGGCLSLLGRNQWATKRELFVNEPKDGVCVTGTQREMLRFLRPNGRIQWKEVRREKF